PDRQVVTDDHAVADEARLGVAADLTTAYQGAGDVAELARAVDLADLRRAELHLFVLGLEQALERRLDLVDRLVDDRVVADVDALTLGQLARLALGPDVEADDHRVGRHGQHDVVLGD